jgi:glycosyl transferase family 2
VRGPPLSSQMDIAVLSLTRDRLAYTQHCFASLHKNAGCEFDHYVFDQGSTDGTREWLEDYLVDVVLDEGSRKANIARCVENIGISRGNNKLLDWIVELGVDYDVYVTFDNDCEVTMPGTLAVAAKVALEGRWIVSPVVRGLIHPPTPGPAVLVAGEPVGPFPALGGIFRVMPGEFARGFRFNEANPLWGGDEDNVGRTALAQGFGMGYLLNWHVNHYETSRGQWERYPTYQERKLQEIGA